MVLVSLATSPGLYACHPHLVDSYWFQTCLLEMRLVDELLLLQNLPSERQNMQINKLWSKKGYKNVLCKNPKNHYIILQNLYSTTQKIVKFEKQFSWYVPYNRFKTNINFFIVFLIYQCFPLSFPELEKGNFLCPLECSKKTLSPLSNMEGGTDHSINNLNEHITPNDMEKVVKILQSKISLGPDYYENFK